jgi:molecular chaperone GrpE (heat shock protein)
MQHNQHFIRKILLIQMLLQIARDESEELESWLKKHRYAKMILKQEINTLHRQSKKIRNEIYKTFNQQQENALLDDIDTLYEIFKEDANKFVGIKKE